MAEGDSPTIARRRVRIAIREAREAIPLTQAQVAEEMEWSLSKVIRIESGDVSISIADLRGVLGLLGIRDKDRVNALLADARIARTRSRVKAAWWREPNFREHLTEDLRRYIEYEVEASEIRYFSIFYVPGPLQTREYSNALTGMFSEDGEMSDSKIDVLVEARQHRLDAMLQRVGSVKVFCLLDESVFWREIGGRAVLIAQLRQLLDLSARGLTFVRMLPYNLSMPIANNGSFDLIMLGSDRSDSELLYRENGMKDEMVEVRVETARHRKRFDQLWQRADDENDTIEFIKARITALEAELPGRQG
ncbi:helix-turn-helix domain-containing protein [Paractinoplanes maris]|uniref:helix-turn-helix domain-containing protein n=1 Tax=Paractinoplanes maris TaxID=1734446 RepID=UPI002021E5C6|nr:helix-turn-helix transcriptional regulator [Actinoplanes maris]